MCSVSIVSMSKKIGVINYGSGNYKLVCNALDYLSIDRIEITKAEDFCKAGNVILPGVGTYGDCMERLGRMGLLDAIRHEVLSNKRNFLGICVGMQILTDFGTEYGMHNGLGIIKGSTNIIKESKDISIPHIGWSNVHITKKSHLFDGIDDNADFYFVHSYCVDVNNASLVSSVTSHGGDIVSSIEFENAYGVQFHPEKSQKNGLKLLTNFSHL